MASIFQHEGTGISFKQAQVNLNSNSLYDGPLHEYALRMYQEVSSLVNDLTATVQYQAGQYMKLVVHTVLGDRTESKKDHSTEYDFDPSYVLRYSRAKTGLDCLWGAILSAMETVDVLQANILYEHILTLPEVPAYVNLADLNKFLSNKVGVEQILD